MSLRTPGALFTALLTVACAAPKATPEFKRLQSPWVPADAAFVHAPGPNTLRGNGFMRQAGGGVVTCAGERVRLYPATPYALERMRFIYGDRGFSPLDAWIQVEPDYAEFLTLSRTTTCDSQGNFTFEALADGPYIVTVSVIWSVGGSRQGGHLMARAALAGGKVTSLVMAR